MTIFNPTAASAARFALGTALFAAAAGCASISAPPSAPTRWALTDVIAPTALSEMTSRSSQPINTRAPVISFTPVSFGITQVRLTEGFDNEVPKISGQGEVGVMIAGGIMNCAVHLFGQNIVKAPRMALIVDASGRSDDRTQLIAYLPHTSTLGGLEHKLKGTQLQVSGQIIPVRSPYSVQCKT